MSAYNLKIVGAQNSVLCIATGSKLYDGSWVKTYWAVYL